MWKHFSWHAHSRLISMVETNPSNICFLPTDISFYLASWYYANSLQMSVYRCSQMLDELVSSHPFFVIFLTSPPRMPAAGNTKGGSITVPLTSCLTGLEWSVLQIKTKIVDFHTTDYKLAKQEVDGTVILPP
jgi:hypothetical protein